MKINVNEINKIKEVCNICNQFADDIYIYAISGNYRVNAKSILGLFSLYLSQEIQLVIDTYKDSTIADFINKINKALE